MIRLSIAKFVALTPLLLISTGALAQSYNANSSGTASSGTQSTVILAPEPNQADKSLIMRQQQRMDLFDSDLKALQGSVEQGLRDLQMQVAQLSSSTSTDESAFSASIRSIEDKLEQLADSVAMTNRRMERTLEITSDVEFRLLRLEKRMQTLMTLGGDDLANSAVQQDTLPAVPEEQVAMQRDSNSGSVSWSVDETKLNEQLANDAQRSESKEASAKAVGDGATSVGGDALVAPTAAEGAATPASAEPAKPEILPDESPDEQYRFALGKALQNDLETAEKAFAEFRQFNKGHNREADAAFWLGRVQFMRGSYEKAAMTFSEFNSDYPDDARLVDTTMWIAESVSHFAPQDQACAIYASLPSLLDSPPDSFTQRLAELSAASNCGG